MTKTVSAVFLSILLLLTVPALAETQAPEEARKELNDRGYFYSADGFKAAADSDDLHGVELFLAAGMNPNTTSPGQAPPIIYAAEDGSSEIVRTLLKHGANVNAIDPANGKTALYYALEDDYPDTAFLLLHHDANPNVRGPTGTTPLMIAAENDNVEMVRLLLQHGADINAVDEDGFTAFSYAANGGYDDVTAVLREQYKKAQPGPVVPTPQEEPVVPKSKVPVTELLKHVPPPQPPAPSQ